MRRSTLSFFFFFVVVVFAVVASATSTTPVAALRKAPSKDGFLNELKYEAEQFRKLTKKVGEVSGKVEILEVMKQMAAQLDSMEEAVNVLESDAVEHEFVWLRRQVAVQVDFGSRMPVVSKNYQKQVQGRFEQGIDRLEKALRDFE